MEINYRTNKLKKVLEDERKIRQDYGKDAVSIMEALTQLGQAKCLNDIPTCPPLVRHKLTGNRKDQWGVWYTTQKRIVFSPSGEYDINDLKSIISITILEIGNIYH